MRWLEIEEGCVAHHEPAEILGRSPDNQRLLIFVNLISAKKPFEALYEVQRRSPLKIEPKGAKYALLHLE